MLTKNDLKVGDRVVVIDDSLEHFHEQIGDTGVVTRIHTDSEYDTVTVLFDEGNGDTGWTYEPSGYDDAVAISMGILVYGETYRYRGKHLPAKILGLQRQEIKWID